MRLGTLSALLVVAAALTGVSAAQETPSTPQNSAPALPPTPFTTNASTPPNAGANDWMNRFHGVPASRNINAAFRALDHKDFARAEEIFADVVRRDPRNPDANFYLGATRMDLGKWIDAKANLELAAREIDHHPDPKSRLGVTYAMLGDAAGANAQRAELMKMAEACKNRCKLSPYIKDGIEMIDEALARSSGPEARR